jgi:hypothetical protein
MQPETLEPFHFPHCSHPQHSTGAGGGHPFVPAAGGLPAAVSCAAQPGQRPQQPPPLVPSPCSPSLCSSKTSPEWLENHKQQRHGTHGARWRKAALPPAPSPARASTPWVSARPSSGPVVAPKTQTPHTDDAAASSCSSCPARRRVKPAERRLGRNRAGC